MKEANSFLQEVVRLQKEIIPHTHQVSDMKFKTFMEELITNNWKGRLETQSILKPKSVYEWLFCFEDSVIILADGVSLKREANSNVSHISPLLSLAGNSRFHQDTHLKTN